MFSYILVVSSGYILLISIFPMLKARKLKRTVYSFGTIYAEPAE